MPSVSPPIIPNDRRIALNNLMINVLRGLLKKAYRHSVRACPHFEEDSKNETILN